MIVRGGEGAVMVTGAPAIAHMAAGQAPVSRTVGAQAAKTGEPGTRPRVVEGSVPPGSPPNSLSDFVAQEGGWVMNGCAMAIFSAG